MGVDRGEVGGECDEGDESEDCFVVHGYVV